MWRERIDALKDAGWQALATTAAQHRLRNCYPCGLVHEVKGVPDLHTWSCQRDYICPWCWGRKASDVFKRILKFVPCDPEPRPSLFLYTDRAVFEASKSFDYVLDAVLARRDHSAVHDVIQKYKPSGSYRISHVVPEYDGECPIWVFQSRIVLLYLPGTPIPDSLRQCKRVRAEEDVSRHTLMRVMASCLRYPSSMLTEDPPRVLAVLLAHKNLRLSQFTGCFRERKKKDKSNGKREAESAVCAVQPRADPESDLVPRQCGTNSCI